MNSNKFGNVGFTLVEIILVIGIVSSLFGIAITSLSSARSLTVNNTSTTVIVSDIKTQQVKSMTGDTEGRGTPDSHGVKILSNQYVLFHGSSYNADDPSNAPIPAETGYQLSSTFPDTTILFASQSGEIVNFNQNQNSITITNTQSGQGKTILFNKYGTITSIN